MQLVKTHIYQWFLLDVKTGILSHGVVAGQYGGPGVY